MKFISAKTHRIIDFFFSALLIASPWIFNFYNDGAETWFPVVLGLSAIIVNLMTNYNEEMSREIPMLKHLVIDFIGGIILVASPWIFGFHQFVFVPHLVMGILIILVSVTTIAPEQSRRRIIFSQWRIN